MANVDKMKLPRNLDRRIKLTEEDRKNIIIMYRFEGMRIREIERKLNKCSRRMIQFILFPERLEAVKKRAIEVKRWDAHNGKDERRVVMREHRAYKRKVLLNI